MEKSCKNCGDNFVIEDEDLKFYEKVSPVINSEKLNVPEPTFCPDCRQQRRLSFRNERKLYNSKCGLCSKNIISIYSSDKAYVVYCSDCWWSDKWDPLAYGKTYDFDRSFFEQFNELMLRVPRNALLNVGAENSDYLNCAGFNKNCYLCFDIGYNESCLYSKTIYKGFKLVDCSYCVDNSTNSYECLNCGNVNNSIYCIDSNDCSDCYFCYDCKGCNDCLFSNNLRNKQYYINNKPYSKEDYKKELEKLNIGSYKIFSNLKEEFLKNKSNAINKFAHIINSEKCTGDYILNSNNCSEAFGSTDCEDSKFLFDDFGCKDCYDDCFQGITEAELTLETLGSYNPYDCKYINSCWSCSNVMYGDFCQSSTDCFGCVSLKKEKYCLLNKKYSKEEYEELVPKVIEHMKKTGEWGEYFPSNISPFAYNETVANEYFPLDKDHVLGKGLNWKERDPKEYEIQIFKIPDDIKEVTDLILNEILACEDCGKNYKIIKQELDLYKENNLPIPRKCPDCRHDNRMKLRNPRKLNERKCDKCNTEIKSTYSLERKEKIYCEECYLKEIL